MNASGRALACVTLLLLAACEGPPPAGFRAVASSNEAERKRNCPDLAGTFEASLDVIEMLHGQSNELRSGPTLLSFVRNRNDGPFIAVWHMDREAFAGKLALARQNEPATYAKWRTELLREGWSGDEKDRRYPYPIALTALGPSYALGIGRYGGRCEDNWAHAGHGDGPGPNQDYEVHLGRNRDGALLAKKVIYNHKPFSIWAASSGQIRTGVASVRWLKTPPPVTHELQAFTAAALPSVSAQAVAAQVAAARDNACPMPVDELVEFNQRLLALLPDGANLTLFHPDRFTYERSGCTTMPVRIGLAVRSAADLPTLGSRLLREGLVRDFELRDRKELMQGATGTLHVTVDRRPAR